mmetsp:Transcript_6333/g.25650  ORF Transcript_6333/g.25650 Transcript_6333/m.25650 type:complete len:205 (-) Transcript_6333:2409-3023(-)
MNANDASEGGAAGFIAAQAFLNSAKSRTLSSPAASMNARSTTSCHSRCVVTSTSRMYSMNRETDTCPFGKVTQSGVVSGNSFVSSRSNSSNTSGDFVIRRGGAFVVSRAVASPASASSASLSGNALVKISSCVAGSSGMTLPLVHVVQNSAGAKKGASGPDTHAAVISIASSNRSAIHAGIGWYSPTSRTNWQIRLSSFASYVF